MMKTITPSFRNFLRNIWLVMILTVAGISQSLASHMAGSDLTYEYLGNGQYRVTWTLYRDCEGITAPTSQPLTLSSVSCNNFSQNYTLTMEPNTGQEITSNCSTALSTCNGGTAPGIQQYVYSTIVTIPAQCPDWQFSVSSCCRNSAITTLANPGSDDMYINAFLNNTTSDNSSPTFSNVPIAFMCIGQGNFYNHGVIDADGDSLVYSFIPPRRNENLPVVYASGFSISNPITSIPAVSINATNGDISMHPTVQEIGVIAIQVLEYRNGVLIGSVMRDMQIYTVPCSNTLPTATGINGSSNFMTTSCAGGQLCFSILASDADPGDTLTMTWNQGIPGATFTTTGSPIPTGQFCWAPNPSDARPQPYTFTVTIRDNACPSNGVQTYSFSVTVSNMSLSVTSSPSVQCAGSHNGSASVTATGNGPLQYLWTDGTNEWTNPSISHLSAGNYTVNVIDASGCVGSQSFTIAEPAPLAVTVTGVDAGCNSTLGSATANVTGGSGQYQYTWSPSGGNGQTASNLNPGNYSVLVEDAHNCTTTGSVDIAGGIPVSFVVNSTPATCLANDGSVTVNASGGSGFFSYVWGHDPNLTGNSATNLIAGSYTVTVSDDSTGCSQTFNEIVANAAGINATISASSDASCSGGEDGSATVVASGGTPPYSYSWANGDTTATTNNLAPGTHLVTVADYNGCLAIATVTIGSVNPSPVVDLGADTVGCNGATITLDAGAGAGLTYLWSDNSTSQTLTVSTPGIYSVIVTNSLGCTSFDAVNVNFIQCNAPVNPNIATGTLTGHDISVYPNPAREQVNVTIAQARKTNVTVSISDILGNKVFFSKDAADYGFNKIIDIHQLPAGVYMMKVEFDGQVQTTRIIKQ